MLLCYVPVLLRETGVASRERARSIITCGFSEKPQGTHAMTGVMVSRMFPLGTSWRRLHSRVSGNEGPEGLSAFPTAGMSTALARLLKTWSGGD